MDKQSIELIIIFKEHKQNSALVFDHFLKVSQNFLKLEFDEISYSIKGKKNLRKGKTLKYKNSNFEKYIKELSSDNGEFELLNYLPNVNYKAKDIKFSISYNPQLYLDNSSSIIITINKAFYFANYTLEDLKFFYLGVLDFLVKLGNDINYGFIFSMDNEKFPALLVAGIGNYNLSENEEYELSIWANKNSENEFKIWRVFWGNLITVKHIKLPFSMGDIKKIVGGNNFVMINPTTCFFNLPNLDLTYGNEYQHFGRELSKLLTSMIV